MTTASKGRVLLAISGYDPHAWQAAFAGRRDAVLDTDDLAIGVTVDGRGHGGHVAFDEIRNGAVDDHLFVLRLGRRSAPFIRCYLENFANCARMYSRAIFSSAGVSVGRPMGRPNALVLGAGAAVLRALFMSKQ